MDSDIIQYNTTTITHENLKHTEDYKVLKSSSGTYLHNKGMSLIHTKIQGHWPRYTRGL